MIEDFPCICCGHLKSSHRKDYWGSYNNHYACDECYKNPWRSIEGIYPTHNYKPDNLKYLEDLYDKKK